IALCDDALELAETPEEIADSILLKVDALLGKGDRDEAMRTMRGLPDEPFQNPNYVFMIGRAYYELGDVERAAPYIEDAANRDAFYYLGLVRDEKGDSRGALEAYLRSRAADAIRAPVGWSPAPEAFAKMVESVVLKLDTVFAAYVREAEVYIVDVPGAELVVDGIDPRACVVLEAVPPSEDGAPPRARLFVYERTLERAAGSLDALEDELSRALEREVTAVFLEKDPDAPRDKRALN